MSSLADRVTDRLKEVGIKPADLARAVRVKPSSVSDWMSGETKTIKGENLLRAAQALQCSPHWLATGIGPRGPTEAGSPAHAAREETVSYFTDKLVEEGAEILRLLDRQSRSEAVQWLRGYAAGRKIEPWASARKSHPVARSRR
jgi:transcriptional regulator with XRE-family HTH domain